MLVFFAVIFAALLGVMGLAVDFGFVALERRTLQKAADAAAMSGAVDLIQPSDWGSINTDVNTMVTRNQVGAGTSVGCTLVDNSNTQVQGNCGTPTSNATSGVRVQLTRTRQNFFLGVLGMPNATISAVATGRVVANNSYDAGNGPFIVCGLSTRLASGGTLSILQGSGPYTVNPSAVGQTFEIHGPQIARCGAGNNAFKGLADQDANEGIYTLPAMLHHDTGVKAGPTRQDVRGPNGCAAGETVNCVMVLPIAVDVTGPPDREAWSVIYLPFLVTEPKANEHHGQLVSDTYQLQLTGNPSGSWTVTQSGLVAPRLVN